MAFRRGAFPKVMPFGPSVIRFRRSRLSGACQAALSVCLSASRGLDSDWHRRGTTCTHLRSPLRIPFGTVGDTDGPGFQASSFLRWLAHSDVFRSLHPSTWVQRTGFRVPLHYSEYPFRCLFALSRVGEGAAFGALWPLSARRNIFSAVAGYLLNHPCAEL